MSKEHNLDGLEEVEAAVLRWNDEVLKGDGFVDWRPFEHPQLGRVEIGGWKRLLRNNAPPQLLEQTCANISKFLLAHAQAAPKLRAEFHQFELVGENTYRIAIAVRNDGYLPTHVTEQALKVKRARALEARIELGAGDELLVGSAREEIGHLHGYGGRRKVEWIARFAGAPAGAIEVAGQRAGVVRLDIADALAG